MLVGPHKGKKVAEVKKVIQTELVSKKQAIVYMEPEKEVLSRSGDACVVALCDQWYLDYGEPEWKKLASKVLSRMELFHDESRRNFENTIGMFLGRCCLIHVYSLVIKYWN